MNGAQAACEHLAQSREHMRQALSQRSHPAGGAHVKLLAQTACGVLATVARNRPLAAVVGTALLGALLVRTKAWRWLSMSAMFAALVPQLVAALSAHERP